MQQWHQFLQNTQSNNKAVKHNAAIIEGGKVISFGDPIAERLALINGTVIYDLSHLGLLELKGADAFTFIQGQVTNDIKLLDGNHAHYTGYCSPKGRLLALFLAFSHYDHIHLQMPKELIESIAKRLKMYVMRSKVEITDVSASIIKFGISGANAVELLKPIFKELPQVNYDLVSLDNGALIKLPCNNPSNTLEKTSRYEIFTDALNAPIIWQALAENAKPVGADCWEWLEIQAGIPEVTLKTQEEFVPQMLNLDALNAINYKKGCYTGQEIVARTHYLGKVKRRTQLAHIASISMPEVGSDVVDSNQQAIGKIVRSTPAIEAGFDVLVECRLENLTKDGIFWQDHALIIKSMPYVLETSE